MPRANETRPDSSLVVVSNRLPFQVERRAGGPRITRAAGGLVTALEPILQQSGGVWVGWPGTTRERGGRSLRLPTGGRVRYAAVQLSAHEVGLYYGGFSNRTLWPLFHYFVGRTQIDVRTWQAYEAVNERFAHAAFNAASADDRLVWVHDYHLLRVAHHLRRLRPGVRIAFFLHIPFPAADVFRVLPWSRLLLRGMLAADLVAFQVPAYVEHFLTCAERLLGCEVDWTAGVVQFEGREVTVQAHPISIDVRQFEDLAREAAPRPPQRDGARVRQILGVDRLDYTKGVRQRLLAIERFLERHPAYRRHILFTQLLVPSRERVQEYAELKRELDELVGRINGRFSEPGWSPIRYLVRSLPPRELVALYLQADVALVTPLRDGMNLVAKEYLTARMDQDGVLVLSELAGAAEELQEALLVNPFDIDAVAEALERALSMPEDERRARMAALRARVQENDVHAWVRRLLHEARAAADRARTPTLTAADQVRRRLAGWLTHRPTVALFVHDEALAPADGSAALPDAVRQVLQQAARTPNLDLVVVSSRALGDVRDWVGVPGITLIGGRGREIEGPGVRRHLDGEGLEDEAILHVLVHRHGADWPSRVRVLYVGDERSDPDVFRALRGMGRSISIATAAAAGQAADFRLPPGEAALQLLRWLASGGFAGRTA